MHVFSESKVVGDAGEAYLDRRFTQMGFAVREANEDEQKSGIDRFLLGPSSAGLVSVDYKTDEKSEKTGNACIELADIYHADASARAGWLTGQAEWLVHFQPNRKVVRIVLMALVREALPYWVSCRYKLGAAPNPGKFTVSILPPLLELDRLVEKSLVEWMSK